MYVRTNETIKCSECGATNAFEDVTRNNKTFRRCTQCGHEKLISEIKTTPELFEKDNYKTISYDNIDNSVKEF